MTKSHFFMSETLINEEHFSLGSYCYLSHENFVSLQFVTTYKQLILVFMNTSVPTYCQFSDAVMLQIDVKHIFTNSLGNILIRNLSYGYKLVKIYSEKCYIKKFNQNFVAKIFGISSRNNVCVRRSI